jgi:hypothetical protein
MYHVRYMAGLNLTWFRAPIMYHVRYMVGLNLILNYIEFRTNHASKVVHGMVQGSATEQKEYEDQQKVA